MKDLNDVRELMVSIFRYKEVDFFDGEWSSNYKLNWGEELEALVRDALGDVGKLSSALNSGDDVMAVAAVAMARVRFLKLSDFFFAIHEDFEKLLHLKEVEWPDIPDDYVY
ncbi:hypothetical protein PSCICO_00020 [Pseudomonas cichorii]|uniref:Uncharacterized protein n=1 Tax=Pseudomonas serbiensis TaxID=3064350 RepID=A0ABT9CXH7_9PSED|nr:MULTISPECIES: hypothetical protein [Pseudomonas]MDO7930130.1 hypothetical protein [Pseudomonas sp. KFB-138]GFM84603.1 hypothetical protein PSCICO_00020 [Pseudomonas cichorii]